MMFSYSLSFPFESFHFLYMTEASTLAGENVLGSFKREIILSRIVLEKETKIHVSYQNQTIAYFMIATNKAVPTRVWTSNGMLLYCLLIRKSCQILTLFLLIRLEKLIIIHLVKIRKFSFSQDLLC